MIALCMEKANVKVYFQVALEPLWPPEGARAGGPPVGFDSSTSARNMQPLCFSLLASLLSPSFPPHCPAIGPPVHAPVGVWHAALATRVTYTASGLQGKAGWPGDHDIVDDNMTEATSVSDMMTEGMTCRGGWDHTSRPLSSTQLCNLHA
jgi:hypothetical protein